MSEIAVVVNLQGGMGNQLFGWACGYALARRLGVPVVVSDARIPKSNTNLDPRQFELGYFGIQVQRPTPGQQKTRIHRFAKRPKDSRSFSEAGFAYDPRVLDLEAPVALNGYFQSKKYFADYQQEILELLTTKALRAPELGRLSNDFGRDWIAVHIRRGDYLKNSHVHTIPDKAYYQRAVTLLRQATGLDRVVVFSDDIQAAQEIGLNADSYIGAELLPSPGDNLILMSQAGGFVGSNSSFSWWAAFLSQPSNRLNVFPRPWFVPEKASTRDLLEPDWLTLGAGDGLDPI